MRQVFVHQAVLNLSAGADERAPGGAVTVALCGHWEHEGPCRWPHHTALERRSGTSVVVRTVFACVAADDPEVRRRIARALRAGRLDATDGAGTWTLLEERASAPSPAERALGERLTAG